MAIYIKDIHVQNLGPHNRLSFELKKLNLIYGHNEHGKTFLVEFIIRSLFRQTKRWHLRKQEGRGKVRVAGLEDKKLIEFSPSAERKIEHFWDEQRPGLPPDFSKLLVIKGAEVNLADVDGGIDRTVLKQLLSNKGMLDHIQKRITKTIQESNIQNGFITGPKRGDVSDRSKLEERLRRLDELFERIDRDYSGGTRRSLAEEKQQIEKQLERLLSAKRYLAFKLRQEIRHLETEKSRRSTEDILRLRSEWSQYKKNATEYRQKDRQQKEAAERSQHFEWLKSARDVYQTYLEQKVSPPSRFLFVAAIIFIVNAAVLSFLSLPEYAAGALLAAVGAGWAYFHQQRAYFSRIVEHEEVKNIKERFGALFGTPLQGMPDLTNQMQALEEDHNTAHLMKKQLHEDITRLNSTKLKIAEIINNHAGERIEPQTWDTFLIELENRSRQLEGDLRDKELRLAQLNVDPTDDCEEDPETDYSQEAYDKLVNKINDLKQELSDQNQNLSSLKQLVCRETGDDISVAWEKVIAKLKEERENTLSDYQDKTAEILGKMAVNQVIEELKQDEESKIVEGLKSPLIQGPLYQLTHRYHRLDLEEDKLLVSDKFNSFELSQLSTGAQEQVLLGLRIGFATKMMQGQSLFLILDDAFQYSDWSRRKLLVDKVAELANEGWQIIYFTMDDNIRTLFDRKARDFGDDYMLINLNQKSNPVKQLDMLS